MNERSVKPDRVTAPVRFVGRRDRFGCPLPSCAYVGSGIATRSSSHGSNRKRRASAAPQTAGLQTRKFRYGGSITSRRTRNPQVAVGKKSAHRAVPLCAGDEASAGTPADTKGQGLPRRHDDRWPQAKLPGPPRVTPVIESQQLAAHFAGGKMQRVGKVDSLATVA